MVKGRFLRSRVFGFAFFFGWLLTIGALPLVAKDVFVVISGGVSPFQNNYSQYLQAKAVAAYLRGHYPTNAIWTFFGAGNVEGEKPCLCDVLHEVHKDGASLPYWEPGSLPQNLPARSDIILKKLREEILPAIADGGTLYLFVGDHGSRSGGKNNESIINLWSMERDEGADHGWNIDEKEALSVTQLRKALASGAGKGKIVFCMTQCHSGGFHFLAMPRDMTPDPAWFTTVPEWAMEKKQPDFPRVAGFTATDEASVAAGCDPDPDPENWSGYERFLPESLFGMNLYTTTSQRKPMPSFAVAHVAATLVDYTIDKPRSTSEQYLERWAELLDGRMSRETNLTAKAMRALVTYKRGVNSGISKGSDAGFRDLQKQYAAYAKKLSEQCPGSSKLLLTGTRMQLEAVYKPEVKETPVPPRNRGTNQPPANRNRGGGGGNRNNENRKLWLDTVRPAWQEAVEDGPVANLPVEAQDFELHLLELEDQGENFFSPNPRSALQEVYWEAGYGNPEKLEPKKAAAMALWGLTRRGQIIAWAKKSNDEDIRAAGERLGQSRQRRGGGGGGGGGQTRESNTMHVIDRETAAERIVFYRRVLAAWEFLIAMNDKPALAKLHELMALERTPLP